MNNYSAVVGLYNYKARMYDPELGLFTTTDPAGQQWGPYTYVGNNPLSYVDPSGMWFGLDDLWAAGIGYVAGYTIHGLTTGDWGSGAQTAGRSSAVAAWVGYNTGGGILGKAAKSKGGVAGLGKSNVIRLSMMSSAGGGAASSAYSYTESAAQDGNSYSMNALTSNWNTGDFLGTTIRGGAKGAVTGYFKGHLMYDRSLKTLAEVEASNAKAVAEGHGNLVHDGHVKAPDPLIEDSEVYERVRKDGFILKAFTQKPFTGEGYRRFGLHPFNWRTGQHHISIEFKDLAAGFAREHWDHHTGFMHLGYDVPISLFGAGYTNQIYQSFMQNIW